MSEDGAHYDPLGGTLRPGAANAMDVQLPPALHAHQRGRAGSHVGFSPSSGQTPTGPSVLDEMLRGANALTPPVTPPLRGLEGLRSPEGGHHHERIGSNVSWQVFMSNEDLTEMTSARHSRTASRTSQRRSSLLQRRKKKEEIPPKPFSTALQQQKIAHCAPRLDPKYVLTLLFLVIVIFFPVGISIIVASDSIRLFHLRYDHYHRYTVSNDESDQPRLRNFTAGNTSSVQGIRTYVHFTLPQPLEGPVDIYYGLKGYYQTHRYFRDSRNVGFMAGNEQPSSEMVACVPLRSPGEMDGADLAITLDGQPRKYSEMFYNPCGVSAWSQFNDSFNMYRLGDVGDAKATSAPDLLHGLLQRWGNPSPSGGRRQTDGEGETELAKTMRLIPSVLDSDRVVLSQFPNASLICNTSDFVAGDGSEPLNGTYYHHGLTNRCSKKGVAWDVDREHQYKHAKHVPHIWSANNNYSTSDPFLSQGYYAGEPGHKVPDVRDEDFMNWMQLAPLPEFKKLFRRIEGDLEAGEYLVEVSEFFDSSSYKGAKIFVMTNHCWIGGKNYALGTAYLLFASLGVVCFVGILFRAVTRGKRLRKIRHEV